MVSWFQKVNYMILLVWYTVQTSSSLRYNRWVGGDEFLKGGASAIVEDWKNIDIIVIDGRDSVKVVWGLNRM